MFETWLDLLADFAKVKGQRWVFFPSLILSSHSASLVKPSVSARMLACIQEISQASDYWKEVFAGMAELRCIWRVQTCRLKRLNKLITQRNSHLSQHVSALSETAASAERTLSSFLRIRELDDLVSALWREAAQLCCCLVQAFFLQKQSIYEFGEQ